MTPTGNAARRINARLSNTPTPSGCSHTHGCGASAKGNKASITGCQAATASQLRWTYALASNSEGKPCETDGGEDVTRAPKRSCKHGMKCTMLAEQTHPQPQGKSEKPAARFLMAKVRQHEESGHAGSDSHRSQNPSSIKPRSRQAGKVCSTSRRERGGNEGPEACKGT